MDEYKAELRKRGNAARKARKVEERLAKKKKRRMRGEL